MKFHLPSWDDSHEVWAEFSQACSRHLEQMRDVLPSHVLELMKLKGVDDGLIVSVEHDREDRVLHLTMRCGDLVMGYYDLRITYEGASLLPEHDLVLARIARDPLDLAYHEVDSVENGRIEHRLLFHYPREWFAIQCDALHWSRTPRKDRSLPSDRNRYPGGPVG